MTPHLLRCFVTASLGVVALAASSPVEPQSWLAIDALRTRLGREGVRVVQRDCPQRGLQGLYHLRSDTLVVCRSHRSHPAGIASLRAYPRAQQLAELEARSTAKLPPDQVLHLFDRYCGSKTRLFPSSS